MIVACTHPARPGYAYCGQCGEALDAPRCVCGFIGAATDRYCGRCGKDLAIGEGSHPAAAAQPPVRRGLPSLARLAAQAAADRAIASPVRKANVNQDEIRKMIATRRNKA